MDLALNNIQCFIYHKTKQDQAGIAWGGGPLGPSDQFIKTHIGQMLGNPQLKTRGDKPMLLNIYLTSYLVRFDTRSFYSGRDYTQINTFALPT